MVTQDLSKLAQPDLLEHLREISESEEMFRDLAENVPCMLWMTDITGAPTYFNRQWLSYTGNSLDDALASWTSTLHPDDAEVAGKRFLEAVASRSEYRVEYRLRRYDGHYRHMLALGMPRYDAKQQAVGYVGVALDITELKDIQYKLTDTHREIEQRSRQIALLNELNDNLQVCKNIDETRPILKRYGARLFPDGAVSICLFNSSRNVVEPFVSWGAGQLIDKLFAPDDCWALRKGKVHVEASGEEGLICPNRVGCGCSHYICVPMMAYGEVKGTLNIDVSSFFSGLDPERVTQREAALRELAGMAADQIALALANLQLRATLQFQSTRDSLTHLYNRRYLTESMEREIARADRQHSEIAVLMIDVDHFKRFNDTYGHAAGDAVLRSFGELLRDILRSSDVACRYGGEEFAVMIPEVPREVAMERAELIRRRTGELEIDHLGERVGGVTVSIGVAYYPAAGDSPAEIIEAADTALYRAKTAGRDRTLEVESIASAEAIAAQASLSPAA